MADETQSSGYTGLAPDYYNPLFNSYGADNRVGLARELSPDSPLREIIYRLRGKVKNPDTARYDIDIERSMNEQGISIFVMAVSAGANEINTYSNYRTDVKLIYSIMQKWITDIVYIFYYERGKFIYHEDKPTLIQDEAYVSIIINLAVGLLLPSFFKALGAGDRGSVTRSVSEMIQHATRNVEGEDRPMKRRGILSRMNPFAR